MKSATEAEQQSLMQELTLLHKGSFGVRSRLRFSMNEGTIGRPQVSKSRGRSHPSRRPLSCWRVFRRSATSPEPLGSMPPTGRLAPSPPWRDSAPPPRCEEAKRTRHLFCREVLRNEFQTVGRGEGGTLSRQRRAGHRSRRCSSRHLQPNKRGTPAGRTKTAITRLSRLGPAGVS